MVDTSGLTRSKGKVSHAGNSATASSPRKAPTSWLRRSALPTVGVTTSRGRRSPSRHIPATTRATAASGTASAPLRDAMASTMAGS